MTGSKTEVILVLLVLGLFALIMLLMIRRDKRSRTQKLARAESLGFRPLAEVPASVQRRIDWLHSHQPTQQLEIRNLSMLERGGHTMFLLDLIDTGGEEVSRLQEDLIMVTSSRLALPRFTLLPEIMQNGVLAKWVNQALQSLVERQGYQTIEMHAAGSSQRFLVFTRDQVQTSAFLERLSFASSPDEEYATIEAGGDAFTYGHLPVPTRVGATDDSFTTQIRAAEQWLHLFERASN